MQLGIKIAMIFSKRNDFSANWGGSAFILYTKKICSTKSTELIIKEGIQATMEIKSKDLLSSLVI